MSNLVKLEFSPLYHGTQLQALYMDVEMHLESIGLLDTILEEYTSSNMAKAKTLIFLRRHLDERLISDKYFHQNDIILPVYRDQRDTTVPRLQKRSATTALQCSK